MDREGKESIFFKTDNGKKWTHHFKGQKKEEQYWKKENR